MSNGGHARALVLRVVLVAALISGIVPWGARPAIAQADGAVAPKRVLIVSIPRLTWTDVIERRPQTIERFLAASAVGNLSLRTLGPRTSLGEAYVTIGAGNRASARDADAGRMLERYEGFENGTASAAFRRRTGIESNASLLHLSITAIQATNARFLYGAEPGAFGTALTEGGWRAAVVGNAGVEMGPDPAPSDPAQPTGEADDPGEAENPLQPEEGIDLQQTEPFSGGNRPAGLAMINHQGEVFHGRVGNVLLELDEESAFGIRLAGDRVLRELDRAWTAETVALVELSDLDRADYYRRRSGAEPVEELYDRALAQTDALLAEVLDRAEPDDMVILVSPTAPRAGETPTPFAVRGPGFDSGVLQSGTTRRTGYVTLPDLAPFVLDRIGLDQPSSMTGTTLSVSRSGDTSAERYHGFERLNRQTRFRDKTAVEITVWFVVFQVVLYGMAFAGLLRGGRRLRSATTAFSLFLMGIPVMTFLAGATTLYQHGFRVYQLAVFGSAALLAAASVAISRRVGGPHRREVMALVPALVTYVVLLVDIVTGGRLQINTAFGYSPVVAGRFAGFGNPAYALFSMSALLIATSVWSMFDGHRPGPHRRRLVAALVVLFAVTVVVDGHPAWGSDVGGILTIVAAAFASVWLLVGWRVRIRTVIGMAAATAATLALFAIFDLRRDEADQTHLARLVRKTFGDEGVSGLLTVVNRKLNANLSLLFTSMWAWSIPLAMAVLVLLLWRRPSGVARHLEERPSLVALLWSGLVLCILGMALNDSGIAVPSVMFTLFLPYVVIQVLAEPEGVGRPGGPSSDGDHRDAGAVGRDGAPT